MLIPPLSRTLSRTLSRKRGSESVIKERFSYQNLRVYEDMIQAISLGEEIASGWDIDNMTAKLASVWKEKQEKEE